MAMAFPRIGIVVVVMTATAASHGCGSSIDSRIESARKRILALDATEARRIVEFCTSWRQEGALQVQQFPSALPVQPTSASAAAHEVTFEWWNNSHFEEDDPHPGFQLICSAQPVPDSRPIAAGLWYRDMPMHAGG
jgi:hypothetical protein